MARNQLADSQYFINRHFSWMQFNERVLEEARDEKNPLLERVKFLAITASNLDEFVEVRVAGMLQQVEHGNLDSVLTDACQPKCWSSSQRRFMLL